MGLPAKPKDFIPGQLKEGVKHHYEYDGSNRMEYAYSAHVGAENGDKCLGTKYAFDGTSDRVAGSVEFVATWDSSWDVSLP